MHPNPWPSESAEMMVERSRFRILDVVGLLNTVTHAKFEAGEIATALPLLERVIELAGGDATLGNFFFESPLALALTLRSLARCSLADSGWRDDLSTGLTMAREVRGM